MKIRIDWCLANLNKAYRICIYRGSLRQFEWVLNEAKKRGVLYTSEISEELIEESLLI